MQTYSFLEWEASGKGLSAKMVTSLLGGVPLRGGTAVVLNAKGGREVSAISKAGLKVLAAYSEAKETFPGVLVDSKTGKKLGEPGQTEAGAQVETGPSEKGPTATAGEGQSKGKEKTAEYAESVAEGEEGGDDRAEGDDEEGGDEPAEGEEGGEESAEGGEGGEESAEGEGALTEKKVEEGAGGPEGEGAKTKEKVEEGEGGTEGEEAAGMTQEEAARGSGEAGESIAGSLDPYTEELERVEAERGE